MMLTLKEGVTVNTDLIAEVVRGYNGSVAVVEVTMTSGEVHIIPEMELVEEARKRLFSVRE